MKSKRGYVFLICIAWPFFNAYSESLSLQVDYENSSIRIIGKALGFVPAGFAFKTFRAEVSLEKDSLQMTKAVFILPYKELSSGSEMKDRRIHAWLDVENHPNGQFELTEHLLEKARSVAKGRLLLHGQTEIAQFEYESTKKDEDTVALNAVAKIDYRNWGLPIFRVFIFGVNPTLEIRLHLEGKLAR